MTHQVRRGAPAVRSALDAGRGAGGAGAPRGARYTRAVAARVARRAEREGAAAEVRMRVAAPPLRPGSALATLAAVAALAGGCSSGGRDPGGSDPPPACSDGTPSASDCAAAPAVPAGQPFTVSGTVEYERVPAYYLPATDAGGLDFAGAARAPVRSAAVEIRQCGEVLATATTDEAGRYTATFTPAASGRIYVVALARSASPPIRVQDNTDCGALWAVGRPLASASATLDVLATHGWTGAGYDASRRIAAPFAILDTTYAAARRVLDARPGAQLPLLTVNWSPLNSPQDGNPALGQIGGAHYEPLSSAMFLSGLAGVDTDEFDRGVIAHEWGHHFDASLSRSDNPGGPHGLYWILDPRMSFGEGFASAFAAMLLEEPIYADTMWTRLPTGQSILTAFGWDAETPPSPSDASYDDDPYPGPFSELSVLRAVYDLHDPPSVAEPWDRSAVGIGEIYDVLVGPQREAPLTSIASFVTGLKGLGADAAAVDDVLASYVIGPITTVWGDGDWRLRAMFQDVPAPSATPASVTATLTAWGDCVVQAGRRYCVVYEWNEQPQNRYFVFTGTGASATVTARAAHEIDLEAYRTADGASPAGRFTLDWTVGSTAQLRFPTEAGRTYVVVLTGFAGAEVPETEPGAGTYTATVTFSSP